GGGADHLDAADADRGAGRLHVPGRPAAGGGAELAAAALAAARGGDGAFGGAGRGCSPARRLTAAGATGDRRSASQTPAAGPLSAAACVVDREVDRVPHRQERHAFEREAVELEGGLGDGERDQGRGRLLDGEPPP